MMRWLGMGLVLACWTVMGGNSVDAKDLPAPKSLTKTGPSLIVRHARPCRGEDLLGNWELVRFNSSHRFKNSQAPYLYPHQVFQYSNRGSAKSVHSLRPIAGLPDSLFATVPLAMTYHVARRGLVILKTLDQEKPLETWSCERVTANDPTAGEGVALQRGDLIMTLLGSDGQPLFVRHLRKSPA